MNGYWNGCGVCVGSQVGLLHISNPLENSLYENRYGVTHLKNYQIRTTDNQSVCLDEDMYDVAHLSID